MTFFVDKVPIWDRIPLNDLTIEVSGISAADMEAFRASNLHLQQVSEVIDTPSGRILQDKKQKGRVYVNGLFVCSYTPYEYGYDFKPSAVKLDRDRRLVSDFDLKWLSSGMWANVASNDMIDLAVSNAADVAFVQHMHIPAEKQAALYEAAFECFIEQYGRNAVPVSSQAGFETLPEGRKGILVNDAYRYLITSSPRYSAPAEKRVHWLQELDAWFGDNRDSLPGDACARFEKIYDALVEQYGEDD
jgi:hypothetical protein